MRRTLAITSAVALAAAAAAPAASAAPPFRYDLVPVATFDPDVGEGAAEIVAYDRTNTLVLVTNGAENRIDIFEPESRTLVRSFDLGPFGAGVQSVDVHGGLAVAVVAADPVTDNGAAVFFDPLDPEDSAESVEVGPLPDMVTFTPNGRHVLVANEGEPRCDDVTDPTEAIDPEGSISIIRVRAGSPRAVRTAAFTGFDRADLEAAGVRVTWPEASAAQDLEPEYVTVDRRSRTAYVSLQENNAVAVVDIRSARVTEILPLGLKDHSVPGNEMDASDRDGADPNLRSWPVHGMYMPDGLDAFTNRGTTYVVSANEGDGREYFDNVDNADENADGSDAALCYLDEARVKDLTLADLAEFDDPDLQDDENLGRLKVTKVVLSEFAGGPPPLDDTDPSEVGGLEYTKLASYGARSITIWTSGGTKVWDSGSELVREVIAVDPDGWRGTAPGSPIAAEDPYDVRSDDKGVEPESVVHGKAYGRDLLFVGLERAGGVITYDASDPTSPVLQGWTVTPGAVSPEGLEFVPAGQSPTKRPLLLVAHEISGTTVAYEVVRTRS